MIYYDYLLTKLNLLLSIGNYLIYKLYIKLNLSWDCINILYSTGLEEGILLYYCVMILKIKKVIIAFLVLIR